MIICSTGSSVGALSESGLGYHREAAISIRSGATRGRTEAKENAPRPTISRRKVERNRSYGCFVNYCLYSGAYPFALDRVCFLLLDRSFHRRQERTEITDRCIVRTPCPYQTYAILLVQRIGVVFRLDTPRYEKLRQDTRGVAFNCRFVNREKRCVRRNDRTKCLANTMLKGNGRNRRARHATNIVRRKSQTNPRLDAFPPAIGRISNFGDRRSLA